MTLSSSTKSYQGLRALPGFGWAWEYARRNRAFQQSWRDTVARFEIAVIAPNARLIVRTDRRLPLDDWDCLYADDPELDAQGAAVIWDPRTFHAIVPMVALPANEPVAAGVVDLISTPVQTTVLKTFDGVQHVLYRDGLNTLHIVVSGADVLEPIHLLSDAAMTPEQARHHAHVLKCLSEMRASGRLASSLRRRPPRPQRLQLVLQALDGYLAGAEPRDIAVALFGEARVKRDWNLPGFNMRDQVRRAVTRGRKLMDGDYRNFLR